MAKCIWCKKESLKTTIEHIIPEAMGCPKDFVLKAGQICEPCNNRLGHLDQAVIDEFDIMIFMAGVRRKKNRLPIIASRGNLVGKYTKGGQSILINMERHSVKADDGTYIGKYGQSNRNIRAKFERQDELAKVSFDVSLGSNPKFVRGIYKIAFSSLAYFLGADLALNVKYDSIRNYVMRGEGKKKVVLLQCADKSYKNEVWPPHLRGKNEYVVVIRLVAVDVIVDLSPELTVFPDIVRELRKVQGNIGWTYLPIE